MDNLLQHGWSSDDWQKHVDAVLHQHFSILGQKYQRVADGVLGDGGLEGFSSDGQAFQAYADQNSNSKAERLEKLKNKISDDVPKLKKYEKEWASRLGDLKLKDWTLVVPIYEDKAVLSHALKKAKELRDAKLPFISKDFRAYVCDINAFPAAVQQITDSPHLKIKLSAPAIDDDDLAAYEKNKPKDIATIDNKLSKVMTLNSKKKILECRRDYLKRYLYRENLLEILGRRHPPLKEKIDELLAVKSMDIVTDSRLDTTPPNQRLRDVKNSLQRELEETIRGLSSNNHSDIAYGTIGHWLINCNLRFNE